MQKQKRAISSSRITLLGFLAVIIIGTLLLWLPISSANGLSVPFSTALFTATSATCVTGLVVVPTVCYSSFGQVVILLLIQIGGLGVIAVTSGFFILLQKRIGIVNRLLIQDAFNLNTLSGLVRFTKKVLMGTFIIESIGALLFMFVFVPQFGVKGIWISVFQAVSAFCNAGMDIIGENSLCSYASQPFINLVTMALIILGGLGFIVWWDIARVCKLKVQKKVHLFKSLTLHSKIVLVTTAILILVGSICFFIFEYNNFQTMGNMSVPQKILTSVFQSVTTRTAGFATVHQESLTNASALLSMLLMFIGGSPVGTAGGIKTVTFVILLLSTISMISNKNDVTLFNRRIPKNAVNKALSIAFISFAIVFISGLLLATTTNRSLTDVLYEVVSANATVGLSRNFTSELSLVGRYIIVATMYFGRVGPIALALSFKFKHRNENIIKEPTEEISVG